MIEKMRIVDDVDFERLDFVFLRDGHHDAIGLLDRVGNAPPAFIDVDGQRLQTGNVDRPVFLLLFQLSFAPAPRPDSHAPGRKQYPHRL